MYSILGFVILVLIVATYWFFYTGTNQDCQGTHDPEPVCPTQCGYSGGTFVRDFKVTQQPQGSGQACPTPITHTCPATEACVMETVHQDCQGTYDPEPVCPTHCGYSGGTFVRDFQVTQQPQGSGQACPPPITHTCPATAACDYYVLNNCVWGSTEEYTKGCPDANQFPGGGTCYKKPLDTSMFKRLTPSESRSSDPQIATRCYNELSNTGMSVNNTLGRENYEQAKNTCESQGAGWRLPKTMDEAGKTCGTGFGYDDAFVWMDRTYSGPS